MLSSMAFKAPIILYNKNIRQMLTAISSLIEEILNGKEGNDNWIFFTMAFHGLIFALASDNLMNDMVDYNRVTSAG